MKKNVIKFISAIGGSLVLGIAGYIVFAGFGGNNCDAPARGCDCFCCQMFNLRGYESCGLFGLILGAILGLLLGYIIYRATTKKI